MSPLLAAGELAVLRLPNWLGDAVMTEPLVRVLVARGPLRLVGPARVHALWPTLPSSVERIRLTVDRPERIGDYRGAGLALLANGSIRSAWCAFAARVPSRVGFAGGARRALLSRALVPARERGARVPGRGVVGRFPRALPRPFSAATRELAALAGLVVSAVAPRLVVDPAALESARERLERARLGRRFLLVHAGSRPGSAKGVPAAHLARIVKRLAEEHDLVPVLCCAPGEEASARLVHAELASRALLLDAPPPGVAELAAWSALAELVLTPDNGARHVAGALGARTLVLCGPTDPRHTGEHAASMRVLRAEVECGPCHRERCRFVGLGVGAVIGERACFSAIDPERVVQGARELEIASD